MRESDNHFQAQAALDGVVAASGQLRTVAVSLHKIANDVRWMASGPRCGLGEIVLPEVQPGSSIMPGKVNPVLAESLLQACARIFGADAALLHCGLGGNLELNTMLPLAASELIEGVEILGAATKNFAERCVRGIVATNQGLESLERSLALATALVPHLGYDVAAAIAREAAATDRTVREVARERTGMDEARLSEVLDPGKLC
jgi:fumarate hydratase class II